MKQTILIAVGSNRNGRWGDPTQTIQRSMSFLTSRGLRVYGASSLYTTAPLGSGHQDPYVNGVFKISAHLSPEALLAVLKAAERASGRRGGRPWGPRTLDLDILDFKGRIQNWDLTRQRPKSVGPAALILPHAQLHKRQFVLVPLCEIEPDWRHPVLQKSPNALLRRLPTSNQGSVLQKIHL